MTTTISTLDPPSRDHLLAILAADAAGYSRLMSLDDRVTVAALEAARRVFRGQIAAFGGRVIDMAGDSVLAVFETATGAVEAALAVQRQIAHSDIGTVEDRRMRFRIGIHIGDAIEKVDGTVYGDGVNVAARLEGLAEPGSLAVSQAVHDIVARRVHTAFDDIGEQTVKNIAQPFRVYRLRGTGVRFGRFELLFGERRLVLDGETVALPDRALDLLLVLAERPGHLISKQALAERVGLGDSMKNADLALSMKVLCQLFGGDIVANIPGRGYRFNPPTDFASQAHAMPRTVDPSVPSPPKLRTNLPLEMPLLLGRDEDLAAVGALIERHRLVTIVGAGGIGKTRLAQTLLASRRSAYVHGVCWVEMASITDGALLPGGIAAALGVRIGGGDPWAALLAAVAPLSVLVALDNAEHLLSEVSRLAGGLHDAAPGLRLVVTSQAPLRLAAERVYRIGVLAVPQGPLPAAQALQFGAVALFTERAQAADSRFMLTDANAAAVIDLCRALDGLALAIELAAARAPLLGVQGLASSMQDRLKLLTTSRNRAAPARQQTLRAALEWSHGLLDEREQTVFRRLGVIAGSASLALVQQVFADVQVADGLDEWAVLDAMNVLVDRSLVTVLISDENETRYRLLDSPRLYAMERLSIAGETESLRRRHALATAALFDAAWDDYFGGRVGADAWMQKLSADFGNAREALACADAAGDAVSALAIGATLLLALPRSLHTERRVLADRCEALIGPAIPERLQQRVWLELSRQRGNTQKQRAREAAQRALTLARAGYAKEADAFPLYLALGRFATAAATSGDVEAAAVALAELQELEDPAWPAQRLLWGAEAQGQVASLQRNVSDALRHGRRMVALDRARGSSDSTGFVGLIDFELVAGDALAAARSGMALVASLEGSREEYGLAFARINLAAAWLALNEREQARVVARAGWPQAARFDLQPYWADYLALLAALEDRPHAAARLAGYADATYAAHQDTRQANEAVAVERARILARAELGEASYALLHAEGATLHYVDIASLAFGTT